MPATQHDLWVWIAGHSYDKVFDASRAAITALAPFAALADETAGWTYKENRDLTGFIDGTQNPTLLGAEDGVRDALTRYATAITGAYYSVPPVEALRAVASTDD